VAELTTSGSLVRNYVWGNDLSGSSQGAGGVGGLLQVTYHGNAVTNAFVAFDGNGNVTALVNAGDGTVVGNYEYGPFGELIRNSGPLAKNVPFRFSTKYQDDESDLLYYGYRYYKASTGTWPNRDPLGEPGFEILRHGKVNRIGDGPNLYEFSKNNSITVIDLFGLGTWVVSCQDVSQYFGASDTVHASPNGFVVTYKPSPGECKSPNSILLFQTVTSPAGGPHVDGQKRDPKSSCQLPSAITPSAGQNSYADSPTYGPYNESTGQGNLPVKYYITAVAVCRSSCCTQKRLSTYYFVWDNVTRTYTASDPNDMSQYNSSMVNWWGN
jgi:RHS repeat-associated protein